VRFTFKKEAVIMTALFVVPFLVQMIRFLAHALFGG
jgi:hypothetical protein